MRLEDLGLDNTKVSDAGLEDLKGLTGLHPLASTAPRSAMPGWNTSRDRRISYGLALNGTRSPMPGWNTSKD